MDEKAIELLSRLVEAPSYKRRGVVAIEKQMIRLLEDYCLSSWKNARIRKHQFAKGRENMLVTFGSDPEVILACHVDTVPISKDGQLKIRTKGKKVYGLGVKDMKGGIVSSLLAVEMLGDDRKKVGLLFYGDEEYEQMGMAGLVKWIPKLLKKKPKLIVSPESRFNLVYGARGILVVRMVLKGKKAHSARVVQGIDAVKLGFGLVNELESRHGKVTELGETTFTVPWFRGGIDVKGEFGYHAGTVPDLVEMVISVRNSQIDFGLKELKELVKSYSKKVGLKLVDFRVELDFLPRLVNRRVVNEIRKKVKANVGIELELADSALAGYNDADQLGRVMGVPVINFGPYGEGNHTATEWLEIVSLVKTAKIFEAMIR